MAEGHARNGPVAAAASFWAARTEAVQEMARLTGILDLALGGGEEDAVRDALQDCQSWMLENGLGFITTVGKTGVSASQELQMRRAAELVDPAALVRWDKEDAAAEEGAAASAAAALRNIGNRIAAGEGLVA